MSLAGKVVLVTGGTRGIGKAIATAAAERGASVIITYRDPAKAARAGRVQRELEKFGQSVVVEQFDITEPAARQVALQKIAEKFGKLDGLVLNAAGGLEADKGEDYAMLVNRDANLGLVNEAVELGLLGDGAAVIYLTSTWAHEYDRVSPPDFYLPVASTKFAAEAALRALIPQLNTRGAKFGVVVAPLVSDTGAFMVMRLKFKEMVTPENSGEQIVQPQAVADATLSFLEQSDYESGHTVYL